MGSKRFSEDNILQILAEARARDSVRAVCREYGISEQTFYRWRRKHPGYEPDAKRLRNLGRENAELKRIVAELTLENHLLRNSNNPLMDTASN